jgi:DNA-binding transcriptional LysR family regulator
MSEWDVTDDLRDGRLVQLLADWTPPFPGMCLYYIPAAAMCRPACASSSTSSRSGAVTPWRRPG